MVENAGNAIPWLTQNRTRMQPAKQPATRDEEIDVLRRCMIRMAEQLGWEPAYAAPTKRPTKMGPDDDIEA